jgi:hypothetical protein
VERLIRAGSNGSVKFAAASCLRGLGLSNTVADAALKLDWSAILNGTNQEEAKPLDTGTIWNISARQLVAKFRKLTCSCLSVFELGYLG